MRIDFIFDAVCPWCYIGKRRLEKALARRPDIKAEIGWRAFLLDPELPASGVDREAYLERKFGSETRIRRIHGTIADAGLSVEIDFNFAGIRRTPNTVDAHRLIRFAAEKGLGGTAAEAVFAAYFVGGRNIGDGDVLADIGADIGLDPGDISRRLKAGDGTDGVMADNARAHRLGIGGVPSFVFGPQMVISGAQEDKVLARIIDAAAALQAAS